MDPTAPYEAFPPQRLRTVRVIWLVFMAAVPVYGIVAALAALQIGRIMDPAGDRIMVTALTAVAVVLAATSLWWRRRFLGAEALAQGNLEPSAILGRFQTAHIVCWAMDEAVTLMGLVATLVTGDLSFVVAFGIAALALIGLAHRPSAATLEDALHAGRLRTR